MTPNEIIEAVNNIEEDIFNQTGLEYINCIYNTNGFVDTVEFMNSRIWSSEDDMRDYIEETDEYEPLDDFLRKEIMYLVGKIGDIRL